MPSGKKKTDKKTYNEPNKTLQLLSVDVVTKLRENGRSTLCVRAPWRG